MDWQTLRYGIIDCNSPHLMHSMRPKFFFISWVIAFADWLKWLGKIRMHARHETDHKAAVYVIAPWSHFVHWNGRIIQLRAWVYLEGVGPRPNRPRILFRICLLGYLLAKGTALCSTSPNIGYYRPRRASPPPFIVLFKWCRKWYENCTTLGTKMHYFGC